MTIFEKSFDLCSQTDQNNKIVKIILAAISMPRKCPIKEETTFCYNQEKIMTLSKSSGRILGIIGSGQRGTHSELVIAHDLGRSSCFYEEHEVTKL